MRCPERRAGAWDPIPEGPQWRDGGGGGGELRSEQEENHAGQSHGGIKGKTPEVKDQRLELGLHD